MIDQANFTSQKLKYPHWQREFEAAIGKGDPNTLRERVDAAEAAIFVRSQALASHSEETPERQAIADAMQVLRTIQKEKLSYPDWHKK